MKNTETKTPSLRKTFPYHAMVFPAVLITFIFSYVPMAGIIMAFQNYNIADGFFKSEFIGLDNFRYIFMMPDIGQVIYNTFFIAIMRLVIGLLASIIFALLLNELRSKYLVRTIQTVVYIPYFISWVLISGILIDLLSPSQGILNKVMISIGLEPVYFLGDAKIFPYVLITTDVWKSFGFGSIVFLAALTNIDAALYEAATVDGANRFQRLIHVSLPGMVTMIAVVAVLNLGGCLNGMFDQVFNLYSPITYKTGDIIDTFTYRLGLVDMQFSPATAFGLFKSVVTAVMVSVSYYACYKFADYRIF